MKRNKISIKMKPITKSAFLLLLGLTAGLWVFAQNTKSSEISVKGKVVNAATKKPVTGINITYLNMAAALTDTVGGFAIKLPNGNVTLLVEGEGYQAKYVALNGRSDLQVEIYEEGFKSVYGNTYNAFTAKPFSFNSQAINTVNTQGNWNSIPETGDAWLQGRVSGVNIIRRSGTGNAGANTYIRGLNSLYATTQPLIVVDNVIYDNQEFAPSMLSGYTNNPMAFIDIRDIDNISVIKDGYSTYGSKGANGVIVINTSRPTQQATKIDAAVYGNINIAPQNIPVMNAADFRSYLSEMLQSAGYTSSVIANLPFMNDDPASVDYKRYHYNTNWQKQVLSGSSGQNGYLKVTGGDNIATYGLTMGFLNNKSVIDNSTTLARYNMRFNADFNISPKLTAKSNIAYTFNDQTIALTGINQKINPIQAALIKSPFLPVRAVSDAGVESPSFAASDIFGISNPAALISDASAGAKYYRFLGSLVLDYKFSKYLSFSNTLAITMDKYREEFFIPSLGVVPDTLDNAVVFNRSGAQVLRLFNISNDARLTYDRLFNKVHHVTVRLGNRYITSKTEQDFGRGFNSATDQMKGVGFGINSLRRIGGSLGGYNWINNYANVEYGYNQKYFLGVNAALDGSSRFGKDATDNAVKIGDNSFALLPSVSAAWLVSSEKFLSGVSWLEMFKLRASYGLSGNDDIGDYTARKYYTSQNLLGMQGLVRGNAGNSELQWETVKKFNAGLDASFLKERLTVSFDVFNNHTKNMIVYENAPTISGLSYIVTNSGALKNTGWEASVNASPVYTKNLKVDVGVTFSQYKATITALPDDEIETDFAGATYLTKVGGTPNAFYGYKSNGVFATDAAAAASGLSIRNTDGSLRAFQGGDIHFSDLNNDRIIDANDRFVIGNPNPDFVGSAYLNITWKNITLSSLFTFVKGNDVYNYPRRMLESMSGYTNQTEAVLHRWRNDGQQTDMPKATYGDPMGNARFSDRWIEDGSYFRLRNLSLVYNIPLKAGFVKYAAVSLTGNNLFTFTKYKGYDPEFNATSSVFGQGVDMLLEPLHKVVQLGVRLGL
jgi:TonB-linked SusC/RagA family outer membrane protein